MASYYKESVVHKGANLSFQHRKIIMVLLNDEVIGMSQKRFFLGLVFLFTSMNSSLDAAKATKEEAKNVYLVMATGGKAFETPQEAIVMLGGVIVPSLDLLAKMETDGKIRGGVGVAERAFYFVIEATSNHEVETILHKNPAWHLLSWKVIPLDSFKNRANAERLAIDGLKKKMNE
jgi:hypothetical protein